MQHTRLSLVDYRMQTFLIKFSAIGIYMSNWKIELPMTCIYGDEYNTSDGYSVAEPNPNTEGFSETGSFNFEIDMVSGPDMQTVNLDNMSKERLFDGYLTQAIL